jgi:DNA ligase-associated metallophosphoesterase
MTIDVLGEDFKLNVSRALLWPRHRALLIADLHLGKVNHFRKSGLAVPPRAASKNWDSLAEVLQVTAPERVIFLGDLFHSHYNEEWEALCQFIGYFPAMNFELIIGNHDLLSDHQYQRARITVHRECLCIDSFLLTHYPLEAVPANRYNICGHVHPGVQLYGKGKQVLTLPCFYFGKQQGILPAFGSFTGLACVTPFKEDRVVVIAENELVEVGLSKSIFHF